MQQLHQGTESACMPTMSARQKRAWTRAGMTHRFGADEEHKLDVLRVRLRGGGRLQQAPMPDVIGRRMNEGHAMITRLPFRCRPRLSTPTHRHCLASATIPLAHAALAFALCCTHLLHNTEGSLRGSDEPSLTFMAAFRAGSIEQDHSLTCSSRRLSLRPHDDLLCCTDCPPKNAVRLRCCHANL